MLSVFPRNVLDEIKDLIKSVSGDFPTFCFKLQIYKTCKIDEHEGRIYLIHKQLEMFQKLQGKS